MKDEAMYAGLMPDIPEGAVPVAVPLPSGKRGKPDKPKKPAKPDKKKKKQQEMPPIPAVQPAGEEEELLLTPEGEEEVLFVDAVADTADQEVFEETEEEKEALRQLALGRVKFSIKLKLGVSLAVLLVSALLFISFWLLNEQSRNLVSEMEFRGRIMSSGLAANIRESFEDAMNRHPIVSETGRQVKDLLTVRVYDGQKQLVDSADQAEFSAINARVAAGDGYEPAKTDVAEILTGLTEQRIVPDLDGIRFTLYEPVAYGTAILGYTVLEFTKQLILDRVAAARQRALIFIGIAIVFGLVGFYILLSLILSPIKRLILGVRQLAEKPIRKVHPIRLATGDELEQFGAEFNSMIKKLQDAEEEKEKKKKLEQEIQIGQDLQKNLLPETYPESECFRFDAYYRPKIGMGGDYFDIIELSEDVVGVIVADVCGKGVPAAIIMVIIRTIFRSVARFVESPAKALDIINKNIAGRTAGEKYATMFYYMFNTRTGVIEYANAAQTPLMIYRKRLHEVREYGEEETPEELKGYEVVGAPIGAREETVFFGNSTQVEEGDVLVLSTDGITEAMNAKHALYDENDLKRDILKVAHLSATEIKDRLIGAVEEFVAGAPQNDDRTLLVLKVEKLGTGLRLASSDPVPAGEAVRPRVAAPAALQEVVRQVLSQQRPLPQPLPAAPSPAPVREAPPAPTVPASAPGLPQRREVRVFRQQPVVPSQTARPAPAPQQQARPISVRPGMPPVSPRPVPQTPPQQRMMPPQQMRPAQVPVRPAGQPQPRPMQPGPVQPGPVRQGPVPVPQQQTRPVSPARPGMPPMTPGMAPQMPPQQRVVPPQQMRPAPVPLRPGVQPQPRPVQQPGQIRQGPVPPQQQRPVQPGMPPMAARSAQQMPPQQRTAPLQQTRSVPAGKTGLNRQLMAGEIVEEEVMFDEELN